MRVITLAAILALIATPTIALAKGHQHHQGHHAQRHHSEDAPKITGVIEIEGHGFNFVSGGRGRGPIPYGDYQITPDEIGPWGTRHGALGIAHNEIPDPRINDTREGIEIHAADHDSTAGCVGIRSGYDKLKAMIMAMIDKAGQAWLHIRPNGHGISVAKDWDGPQPIKVAEKEDEDTPKKRVKVADDESHSRHHRVHYARHHHHHYARARHSQVAALNGVTYY